MIRKADETLLDEIRAAYARNDPIPAPAVDAAKAALAWADPDAALADLVADSALETATAARTDPPDPTSVRLLSFAADDLTVELEASAHHDARALAGRIEPPGAADVHVRCEDGRLRCRTDDNGHFSADGVPAGLVRLEIRRAGAATVVTSWVRV
jgi:hypothetical protein